MDTDNQNRSPLLPMRHPQDDFFIADIFDAVPKSDAASLEHPLFTLATRPDMTPREYKNGNLWLKVSPSDLGLATVHDRDILIYCISQCIARLNDGLPISKTLRFNVHDLLKQTNRPTNNLGYDRFRAALNRLQSTRIETNITTGGEEQWDVFSFIDKARTIKQTRDGRMMALEITLSDWVFNAINGKEVLTISRDYFRLRKPLERRLYELARKHCGNQAKWEIRLDNLQAKCGSSSSLKEFRRMVLGVVVANQTHRHIPHYDFILDKSRDVVVFRRRASVNDQMNLDMSLIRLDSETYETARALAPGWDIYAIEQEWKNWMAGKGELPKSSDLAFLGFVRSFVSRNKLD